MTGKRSQQWQADLTMLSEIRSFVEGCAKTLGANDHETLDVLLAVNEAVTNSILHGYGGAGLIRIEVRRDAGQLHVCVADDAPPFDPTSHTTVDVNRPLDDCGKGGMGIHMMRELTDEMVYHAPEAGGNELTLIKFLED
ncbi:MAG: ATP-binding protein [Chloroflexi bacterium]|nr:ATP-binding protein [Chloroflexota bacterium]